MHLFNTLFYHSIKILKFMQKISTFTLFISKTNLFWNLTKIIDEADGGVFLEGVVNAVDVDISLVEQMMEHIN